MSKPIDRQAFLDLVKADPRLTSRQLASRLGCSTRTIRDITAFYDINLPRAHVAQRHTRTYDDPAVAAFFRIHDATRNPDKLIADEAGVTGGAISQLRAGTTASPRLETLRALLRVYGYELVVQRIPVAP